MPRLRVTTQRSGELFATDGGGDRLPQEEVREWSPGRVTAQRVVAEVPPRAQAATVESTDAAADRERMVIPRLHPATAWPSENGVLLSELWSPIVDPTNIYYQKLK